MFFIYDGATEFNQWEQGKMLINEHMKVGDCVVFRNAGAKTVLMTARQEGNDVVVDVPNVLLADDRNIVVYLKHHYDCKSIFEVNPCDRPDGYVFEDNCSRRGSGIVPDWNQNDPNAPDYIKNRPFHEDREPVTYLESHLFYMPVTGEWENLPFVNKSEIVVGKPLKVTYDGEMYECVVHDTTGMVGFGNGSMYSDKAEDTHEPFVILFNGPSIWVKVTETGNHTLSVVGYDYKSVPKKIDPKYIPEWNELENVPFSEKTVKTSIEGMTIGDFPIATSGEKAHNLNVPLALGQKWSVYKNSGSLEGTYEVQEDEYGRLYVCGSPVKITADTIQCDSSWVRMLSVQRIYIVGVSGTITETEVKKIDPKFIPEKPKIVFELDAEGIAHVTANVEDLYTHLMGALLNNEIPNCIYRSNEDVIPVTSFMLDTVDGAVFCNFLTNPMHRHSAYQFIVTNNNEVAGAMFEQ